MSYCVNCGVELEASLKACPLCHTPVINPKQIGQPVPPSPYPVNKGQVEVVKRKDLGILLSVVLIATSGTCLLLNLLAFNNSLWSLLVIGICICLFVFTFPAVYYSKTPVYISLLADGVAVAVYLYMIGFLTPSHCHDGDFYIPGTQISLHRPVGSPLPVHRDSRILRSAGTFHPSYAT